MKMRLGFILLFVLSLVFLDISCSNRPSQNTFGYNQFYNRTSFLPDNFIYELNSADKTLFSQNVFDLQFRITDQSGLNSGQREKMKDRIHAMLKTFNYTVYTRSFATAMQRLDGKKYLVNTNDPNNAPGSIAVLLALRGLNSRNFELAELSVELVSPSGASKSFGEISPRPALDSKTGRVLASAVANTASWDFWKDKEFHRAAVILPVDASLFQTTTPNNFYVCSDNEQSGDGVFTYRDFVRALLQTIFTWRDFEGANGTLLLDAVTDTVVDVTCRQLATTTTVRLSKQLPFDGVDFRSLRFLGYNRSTILNK